MRASCNVNFLVSFKGVARRMFNVFTFGSRVRFRTIGSSGARRDRFIITIGANFGFGKDVNVNQGRERTRSFGRYLRVELTCQRRVEDLITGVSIKAR